MTFDEYIKYDKKKPVTFTYTHDITDNGFDPGIDTITGLSLVVGFRDDEADTGKKGEKEYGLIDWEGPGSFATGEINTGTVTVNFGSSLASVIATLAADGRLTVTVSAKEGDFYLTSSVLTARGREGTAVPLPGVLGLMGIGLAGAGIVGSRGKRA